MNWQIILILIFFKNLSISALLTQSFVDYKLKILIKVSLLLLLLLKLIYFRNFHRFKLQIRIKMASSLHFHCVRTPCNFGAPTNSHSSRMALLSSACWPGPGPGRFRFLFLAMEDASGNGSLREIKAEKNRIEAAIREDEQGRDSDKAGEFTCVMKFGGSSLASADRIREIAGLILSFSQERPVIVLSAMGKTTNNLLLVNAPSLSRIFFIQVRVRVSSCRSDGIWNLDGSDQCLGWGDRCQLWCFQCV